MGAWNFDAKNILRGLKIFHPLPFHLLIMKHTRGQSPCDNPFLGTGTEEKNLSQWQNFILQVIHVAQFKHA